jgi:hypothetical protein
MFITKLLGLEGLDIMANNTIKRIRRAIKARQYYDNWFQILIRLLLSKLGIVSSIYVKLDNCIFEIDPNTFERLTSRLTRGYLNIKSLKCNKGKLYINDVEVNSIYDLVYSIELQAAINGWKYDAYEDCWIKNFVKFKRMYYSILEIFDEQKYKELHVAGRIVIDVGAFVGDSAIYFGLKGAKKLLLSNRIQRLIKK